MCLLRHVRVNTGKHVWLYEGERGIYSKGPGSVDPNHQSLGDMARLCELAPLPHHVIICILSLLSHLSLALSYLYNYICVITKGILLTYNYDT
jgi:hypothetical protein